MSKKSAISGVILVLGFAALSGKAYHDREQKREQLMQEQMEAIAVEPLNGEFVCEFYKAKTQVLDNITWYEVQPGNVGWNWTFTVEDGTAIFYTQTAGQFCYVMHVGEEE